MANLYDPSGIGNLDPDDFNAFQSQRRQAKLARDLGKSQNDYRRTNARLEFLNQDRDRKFNYGMQRRQFGSDLNRAGLLNSGIYKQGYQDLQTVRLNQKNVLAQSYDRQVAGLRDADWQLDHIYANSLNDTDSAEAARVASVAAALKYAREHG